MAEETKESTKKPITNEIATTEKDIDIFSGWLTRLENPDPIVLAEAGGAGLKLYDDVDRDGHAGSVLETRYLAVAGCDREITPADDSARSVEIADFVDNALKHMNFTQSVFELMQALLYGFYVSEVIWTSKNGAWLPEKLISKHPRRFAFSTDRELRLLTPSNMIDGEPVPDKKFILFTFGSSDNPYGKGLGQKLWWPVWFKKHGIKYWMIFLEKFGMPTGVGKYPPGTSKEDQEKLLDAIDAIQNETGITVPDNMIIELLEATRQGKVTYETLCEYMDKIISKAVLGQVASTEGTPGKLGNEDSQEEVRQDRKKADADLIAEVYNATLIRWIVDYNFSGVTQYPNFWLRTDPESDLKALAERDEILVNKIGLKVGRQYFYDTYGIPEPEEGEETLGRGSAPDKNPDAIERKENKEFAEKSKNKTFTPDQQALEDLIDDVLKEAGPHSDKIANAVKDAIDKAESYEDLHILLAEAMGDTDASKKLDELLSTAMMAADMWGRYAAS